MKLLYIVPKFVLIPGYSQLLYTINQKKYFIDISQTHSEETEEFSIRYKTPWSNSHNVYLIFVAITVVRGKKESLGIKSLHYSTPNVEI